MLNGPERPQALDSATISFVALPFFGARLIQQTLSEYFSSKGLRISHEMSTTRVVLSAPVFSEGPVAIYTGIEFQVRRPFKSLPENYVLSVQWKASVSFRHSLADDSLRGLAVGTPVLFRPLANANLSPEVRGFRNRYIGMFRRSAQITRQWFRAKTASLEIFLWTNCFQKGLQP